MAGIFTERNGVAFAIEGLSGHAIIEPANASVALPFDHQEEIRAPDRATPAQVALLARRPDSISGRFGRLRVSEAVISIDDRVTVVGAGTREPDHTSPEETGYRSARTLTATPARRRGSHVSRGNGLPQPAGNVAARRGLGVRPPVDQQPSRWMTATDPMATL